MNYLFIAIVSYLIGSFPTAFILLKYFRGLDIRTEGTGNVGGHNAFEVSHSKIIGTSVGVIDLLKGLISVYIAKQFDAEKFLLIGLALFFAVLGHCFSIWIKFRGGRGLATAFGGTLLFLPYTGLIWGVLWVIVYLKFKDIHIGNIWATIFTFVIIALSKEILIEYSYPPPNQRWELFLISLLVLGTIFLRHIEPMMDMLRKRVKQNKG